MAEHDYDLAIVGGGVAGSSLATRMAREGARVLLLESTTTFRDRVRGEFLLPWGVVELRRLGLLDTVVAAGAHELKALAGRGGKPQPLRSAEGDPALAIYHPDLQNALLDAAVEAGAEVLRGTRVSAVQDGQPPVVTFDANGETREVRARLVVGADGRNSSLRELAGGESRTHRSSRLLTGVRLAGVQCDESIGFFILREDVVGVAAMFPQGDGRARAYVFHEGDEVATYQGESGLQHFIEFLVESGVPNEVLAGATATGPLAAFVADDSWLEHPATDHVVLIGDAAGITDPTWGAGLSVTFGDVRGLSEALIEHEDWSEAAHAYAETHDHDYDVIRTLENWNAELLLTAGPVATQRRRQAQMNWGLDPTRIANMVGFGPAVDISERARLRFFGEDEEATKLDTKR